MAVSSRKCPDHMHAYVYCVVRLTGCANDHVQCCTQSGMGPEVPAFKGSYAGSTGFAAHDRAAPAAQVEAGAAEEDGSDHGSIGADPADLQMQQVRHGVLKYAPLYVLLSCVCLCSLAAQLSSALLLSIPTVRGMCQMRRHLAMRGFLQFFYRCVGRVFLHAEPKSGSGSGANCDYR